MTATDDLDPDAIDALLADDYPDRARALELAGLLDELHGAITSYVVMPSPEDADAATLFTAATHRQAVWEHATRFVIKSPIKRCGKTRLQEVIAETAHKVLKTVNISPAALARSIDKDDPPTLILDEADTVFGPRKQRAEGAEDIRGILNSGHSRGWPYIRWDANKRQAEHCPTFAMAVIGGIGDMPDTIEDRAVIISMRRRAPGETVKQWRSRRAIPPLRDLRDRLHACIAGLDLADVEPDLPVEDRAADVWEPLVAIADAARGDWPDRARKACQALTGAAAADDADTAGERLLSDLRVVFGDAKDLETSVILEELHGFEEAPWRDWYGHELNARDLAKLLRPYGVKSRNVVRDEKRPKGYHRDDLTDAWARYARPAATSATGATSGETAGQSGSGNEEHVRYPSATESSSGNVAGDLFSSATGADQRKRTDVADVAAVAAERANGAGCTCPCHRGAGDHDGHPCRGCDHVEVPL